MPSLRVTLAFLAEVAFVIASIFTNIPESWRVYAVGSSWILLALSVCWYVSVYFGVRKLFAKNRPVKARTIAIALSVILSFSIAYGVWILAARITKAAEESQRAQNFAPNEEGPCVWVSLVTITNMGTTDTGVPEIKYEIANTGDNAQKVYTWLDEFRQIVKTNSPAPTLVPSERSGPSFIPPRVTLSGNSEYPILMEKKDAINKGDMFLYFHMALIYEDAVVTSASKRYEMSYCWIYNPSRGQFNVAQFGTYLHPTDSWTP